MQLCKDVARTIASYIRGQILVTLAMLVFYSAGFYYVGVPWWFLCGFLCGLFHLVPVVGATLALIIPISASLLGGGGSSEVLRVLVVFVLAQLVESFYLTPKILGAELSLRPLVVFLAVLLGGLVFGVIGALVAVPAVAIGVLIWKTVRGRGAVGRQR